MPGLIIPDGHRVSSDNVHWFFGFCTGFSDPCTGSSSDSMHSGASLQDESTIIKNGSCSQACFSESELIGAHCPGPLKQHSSARARVGKNNSRASSVLNDFPILPW